ncbi:Solute carrier family 13 member 2 [Armadillidium vulgare]|nr:Solute carrier family 13 member 2 [Armadillidium vulgare]
MNISSKTKWILKMLLKDWRRYPKCDPQSNCSDVGSSSMAFVEARCAYVILLMAIYYMTEALPLAVTALMPVFAFPLLGIISTDAICRVYMRGTAMMFFGGLAVAIAVEHCNLHKRIALFVILRVGQSPRRLMGSFMLTTMFLSMWISNTAATAMMIPILDAILQELYKSDAVRKTMGNTELTELPPKFHQVSNTNEDNKIKRNSYLESDEDEPVRRPVVSINTSLNKSEERLAPPDKESQALSTMYFLATAYGSNLGGTGFPTGTGPNLVLWGIMQSSFPEGTGLNFATWMAFNIPGMILCVACTWVWLEILCRRFRNHLKKKKKQFEGWYKSITMPLARLPFMKLSSQSCSQSLSSCGKVGNATPAILIVFLLFVIPSKPPWCDKSNGPTPACLTWDVVHRKVPWGLVILMGGGFAMAEGASASGLSNWLRLQLQSLQVLPGPAIVFLVCLITTFLTEIISNITAASILLPVLKDMALGLGIHPLYLMLPGAVCCSYAFMLPVANPPNAIAFNASTMKNSDMIKAGFILNFICVFIMTGLINTLGVVLFDLHTFPEWAANAARAANATTVVLQTFSNETLVTYS